MDEQQYITQEGYDKMKRELDYLENTRRHEIAERIERAKELGDLSENAEYSEAKDEQAFNEGKILEIRQKMKSLVVVKNGGNGHVDLGSQVTVEVRGTQKTFSIVSFNEVDPENNKISNESSVGQALLGKKVGEEAVVKTPSGEVVYKVIKIE